MGILNQLQTQGSSLSKYNGGPIPTNPLATQQSLLHADQNGDPGYSINGSDRPQVTSETQQYDNTNAVLPQPTQLSDGGITPPQYLNNLPQ